MIALRQSYIAHAKTISSIAVQAGDLVLVGLYQDGAQVATSCADSASNTYSKVAEQHITDGAGCGVYLYYTVAGATGNLTITGTMAGSGYNSIFVHVYSGTFNLGTVLQTYQAKGETVRSTSHTSGSLVTTAADALLVCLWGEPSGSGTISENGSGFTERQEDHGTATYDRTVSSAGTYANAVTSTVSSAFASVLAAFIEVPAQGSGGPWRGVFPGTWSPSEAAIGSKPPGSLIVNAMLGAAASGVTLNCPTPPGLNLAGLAASLALTLAAPAPSALTLQGQVPSRTVGVVLQCPAPVGIALSGKVPSLGVSLGAPAPGSAALSGKVPALSLRLAAPTTGLALSGTAPALLVAASCPAPASMALAGYAPTLQISGSSGLLCPTPSGLTISGKVPALSLTLSAPSAALTLASYAPALSVRLAAPLASLALTGTTPGLSRAIAAPAPSGLALSGKVPSLALRLAAPSSALGLTANAPTLAFRLRSEAGALVLQGYAPELHIMGPIETDPTFILTPLARSYTLTASARFFVLTPAPVYTLTAPARTTWTLTPPARIYEVTA